ncbi:hypothetical protein BaRGS_00006382 [Batillaria attramentaria]|uniref:PCNA-associated factor n=1 Tax=Batillaria attramentaria TaxID=370345 RepID=A0ABD0LS74_9CAEN
MVRTKADSCPAAARKVVAARAPRKKYGGGNPVCPRPTPDWQKGIGSFLVKKPSNKENEEPEESVGCSSGSTGSGDCSSASSSGACAGSSKSGSDCAGPSGSSDARLEDEEDDS